MKKLFILLLAISVSWTSFAQAPQKMSYQAVIRNSSNALIVNTVVGMKISILAGSTSGSVVYSETQNPTTNENGLASIEIGTGTVSFGTFSMIDWSAGPYFIKTEIDPSGGSSYSITATSQLLSVPYAMYAEKTNCSSCDNQFINANGDDTMNGTLTVDQIDYTTPRVHYAFVGEADFVARSASDNVQRATGNGGAYITTSSSTLGMIGRLHVPVGASITNVEIALFDNSATEDLHIGLTQHSFTGAYYPIGSVTSSGNSGFSTLTLSTGLPFTVGSSGVYEFIIYAKNGASIANWPGSSLVIRNIKVTYTLSSAQ